MSFETKNQYSSQLEAQFGKVMTPTEVASVLKVGEGVVMKLIESGKLKASSLLGEYRLQSKDVTDFFDTLFDTSLDNKAQAMVTSSPTITTGGVVTMPKAHISRISKGNRFLVQIKTGVDENGKPIRTSKSFRSEEDAIAYKEELDRQYANTAIPRVVNQPRAGMAFVDFINYYYKNVHASCGNRTLDSYFISCRTIRTKLTEMSLAHIALGDMTESVVTKVLKALADDKKSQSTIDKARLVFTQSLGEAFHQGYIGGRDFVSSNNKRLKIQSNQKPKERIPYTDDEIAFMLERARSHATLLPILEVFACTGMRPEELRVLEWKNLDFDNKTIRITGAAVTMRDEVNINTRSKAYEILGSTKSPAGVRTLPLSDSAIHALRDWRETANKHAMGKDSKYIFFSDGGGFLTASQLKGRWDRFLGSNGLKDKGYILYRFRHTICTKLFKKGFTTKQVAAFMGDSTTRVVEEIYTHLRSEDMLDDFREAIN